MSVLFDDASSEYLDRAGAVVNAPSFTVACWANSNDTTVAQALFNIAQTGSTGNHYLLWLAGNVAGDPLRFAAIPDNGIFAAASTTNGYTANTWRHCCAIEGYNGDAASRRVILDGNWANSGTNETLTVPGGMNRTAVGRFDRGSSYIYMSGSIAEIAVWNLALLQGEVEALGIGRAHPLAIRPANLVLWLPMKDVTDLRSIIGDYTFTAYNTPASAEHIGLGYPGGLGYVQYTPAAAGGSAVPAIMRYYRNRRVA
uniref:Putative lectin/glucanase superfamily protein n=1 Tax=viral metagenome TaxID=1070528 RepID=A0A6M3L9I2_9ZZZZ